MHFLFAFFALFSALFSALFAHFICTFLTALVMTHVSDPTSLSRIQAELKTGFPISDFFFSCLREKGGEAEVAPVGKGDEDALTVILFLVKNIFTA